MKFILLVVALASAATAIDYPEDTEWIDFRLASAVYETYSTTAPTVCDKIGFKCKDCDILVYCNYINGEWKEKHIEDCKGGGSTCNANTNKCSNIPSSGCDLRQFSCNSLEGMYPDPTFCKKFHYCVPGAPGELNPVSSECGKDFGYNPLTTYCSKKLTNEICPDYPVPICNTLGQKGALKENPTIYYTCLPYDGVAGPTLYPFLYLCENGKKYDASSDSCK